MGRCFYHKDLGQNAVFHNFALQIAHSIFRTIEAHVGLAWAFSETIKKISKITYTANRRVVTFDERQSRLFKLRLIELYAST